MHLNPFPNNIRFYNPAKKKPLKNTVEKEENAGTCYQDFFVLGQGQILPFQLSLIYNCHSSVGSVADLRRGGCWFDPWLSQYSFQGLMIVIVTGFIPLSPLSVVSTMVMLESSQGL